MTDKPYDPSDDPACQRKFMRMAVWWLNIEPVEKLVFLWVMEITENDFPGMTELANVAEVIGASLLDTSRAITSLKAKGLLKVCEPSPGLRELVPFRTGEIQLDPDFQGFREFFWQQKHGHGREDPS